MRIHNYGPHYFRTNDDALLKYLPRFTSWIPANYEVQSLINGKLLPFPINLTTLERFFGKKLTPLLGQRVLDKLHLPIACPANSEEYVLSRVGRELYEAFYLPYTKKQWGVHPRELDAQVCGRVPVRLNRDHRYVEHRHQVMPDRGFTALFDRMLRHRNIRVLLDCPFSEVRRLIKPRRSHRIQRSDRRIFCLPTGQTSLSFAPFRICFARNRFMHSCVQINYPNDFAFTRSVEIKHVTGQQHKQTVVSYETPSATGEPFYPIPQPASNALYLRMKNLANRETVKKRVYFCGQLAEYRYFNTDEVIQEALKCFHEIRQQCSLAPLASLLPT